MHTVPHVQPPLLLTVALAAACAPAQCTSEWNPLSIPSGVDNLVGAIVSWDPDGVGPAGPLLIVSGPFLVAGNILADGLATLDPATWTWNTLGAGLTGGGVGSMAVMQDGSLVAAGNFQASGTTALSNIARWDGSTWSPLGSGLNDTVSSLVVLPNGDLVAAGWFTAAGATPASHIARWDGIAWHALGSGTDAEVLALTVSTTGDVVAAGNFWLAGGIPVHYVARWDGASWHALGQGMGSMWGVQAALATMPNGDIVLAGRLKLTYTSPTWESLAKWDGTAWSILGGVGSVNALAVGTNGDLYVGGYFTTSASPPIAGVARLSGGSWSGFGAGIQNHVYAICLLPGGALVAGGDFNVAGGIGVSNLALWDGTAWRQTSAGGSGGSVTSLCRRRGPGCIVAGDFDAIGGTMVHGIATWNGSTWSAVGAGIPGVGQNVHAVAETLSGDVIAGGSFAMIGNVSANGIAKWDGTAWNAIGPGGGLPAGAVIRAVLATSTGDIIAAGSTPTSGLLRRWNGAAWVAMGAGAQPSGIDRLVEAPNGDILASGLFWSIHGVNAVGIARWDASAWYPLGGGIQGGAEAMTFDRTGDLVVGGSFFLAGGTIPTQVARWDGTTWQAIASDYGNFVRGMTTMPDGDILVAGALYQIGQVITHGVARWDGTNWSPVGPGIGGHGDGAVAVTSLSDDSIAIAGDFSIVGGMSGSQVVQLRSTCPAQSTPIATACTGSTGPLSLATSSLPWTGGAFASACSGFTTGALAASAVGLASPATSLGAYTPFAGPGCVLLATPDSLALVGVSAGIARDSFDIPNDALFAGIVLFHQMLQLEVAGASIVSSSNGLRLVVGGW